MIEVIAKIDLVWLKARLRKRRFKLMQWRRHGGGLEALAPPPIPRSRQKLAVKNGMKLVGYTFRLKNYVKIPPPISLRVGAATELMYAEGNHKRIF